MRRQDSVAVCLDKQAGVAESNQTEAATAEYIELVAVYNDPAYRASVVRWGSRSVACADCKASVRVRQWILERQPARCRPACKKLATHRQTPDCILGSAS